MGELQSFPTPDAWVPESDDERWLDDGGVVPRDNTVDVAPLVAEEPVPPEPDGSTATEQ